MKIYQIKIVLKGISPAIWRRFRVKEDTTLKQLHRTLQTVMGWDNDHLHLFRVGRTRYSEPEFVSTALDESKVTLKDVFHQRHHLAYEYDFGDGWEHLLALDGELSDDTDTSYPICIAGERACPPEDCGGPIGYMELLDEMYDAQGQKLKETITRGDGEFDPNAFDVNAVNRRLGHAVPPIVPPPLIYASDKLAQLSLDGLVEQLVVGEDRVPRQLIDECARRGDAMVEKFRAILARSNDGADGGTAGGTEIGQWWLLPHAVMILGLIPSEAAGLLLIDFMRRISQECDEQQEDWLAGSWTQMYLNKPETIVPALQALSLDRNIGWFMRSEAIASFVMFARRKDNATFESALDWVAEIAADPQEEAEMRGAAATLLLDFPRSRHRALLDKNLALQEAVGLEFFFQRDIQSAYAKAQDSAEWDEGLADAWDFYLPEAIEERRQSWEQHLCAPDQHEIEHQKNFNAGQHVPYVSPTPKIGRNDPCPCGSGKKYKKCCLQ